MSKTFIDKKYFFTAGVIITLYGEQLQLDRYDRTVNVTGYLSRLLPIMGIFFILKRILYYLRNRKMDDKYDSHIIYH